MDQNCESGSACPASGLQNSCTETGTSANSAKRLRSSSAMSMAQPPLIASAVDYARDIVDHGAPASVKSLNPRGFLARLRIAVWLRKARREIA